MKKALSVLALSARYSRIACAGIACAGMACTPTPPPLWAEGGATLSFSPSEWTQADGTELRIDERGQVFRGRFHVYSLDRAGRVVDDDNDPVALLDPDGQLFGTEQTYWGRVGLHNAAPPWGPEAWVRVTKKGQVVLFDADGETINGGSWTGCTGDSMRSCTLMTHITLLESVQRQRSQPNVYFGVGMGYYY